MQRHTQLEFLYEQMLRSPSQKILKEDSDEYDYNDEADAEYDEHNSIFKALQEALVLANDYNAVQNMEIKQTIKKKLDGMIFRLSGDNLDDNAYDMLTQIEDIIRYGSPSDEAFDSENEFERRLERMGHERGY